MGKGKLLLLLLILVGVGAVGFFAWRYQMLASDLQAAQSVAQTQRVNYEAARFLRIFVREVLMAKGEVSFDTRLNLENMVRNMNDNEVLVAWQKFTGSRDEVIAQNNVKELLNLLADRVAGNFKQ